MRTLAVFLTGFLALTAGAGSALAGPLTTAPLPDSVLARLPRNPRPTRESVELTLDPGNDIYEGRVTIALETAEPVSELRFHARALTLDDVTLRGPSGEIGVASVERLPPDQARVRLATPLPAGASTLSIRFHNRFNTQAAALYKVVTGGHSYLFTQFEDTEAREAFPCWDEPEFKFPWTLTLTVPATHLAVSNTPVRRETRQGAVKKVEFAETQPLPSYLIAIAVGPFETVPIEGLSVPGRIVTVQGASGMAGEAARVTPAIIRSLENYFGRPYPYEKLDLIAAPEFLYGAMENAGAVVFADRRLLIDPRSVNPDQRNRVVAVIAHELAHMWFGDLVTMKWWDDLWLNESFATWMANKVMDDVFPEFHEGTAARFSVDRALATDSRPSTRAMRGKVASLNLGETANELTYNKGQAVLTMFEGRLGPDMFRAGVLQYLKSHEWRNAEGRDLWHALGNVSGENIESAMASFLDQSGVPIVTVEPLGGGRVRLRQHRFLTVGDASGDSTLWRIPVGLRYPTPQGLVTKPVWLTGREISVELGTGRTPDWIEPNAGGSGYYRWSVPPAMIDSLVASKASLDPRERLDLISNLSALLRAGLLTGDRYLADISRLADDPEAEVVRAAAIALNDVRAPFDTKRADTAFARYLRDTFAPALGRIGMKPAAGEPLNVTLLRPLLLWILADAAEDTSVLEYAESLSRDYRRDPASVPPSLVETGIVLGARRGDRAQFEDYRKRFESTAIPIERSLYLAGLAGFRDPALRREALSYALSGPLRPQEVLTIPSAMATDLISAESRSGSDFPDEITRWMSDHFAELASRMPPNFAGRLLVLAGGCSEERIDTLERIVHDPEHRNLGVEARAQRLADAIEECSTLNSRESGRAEAWLTKRAD